ncbi:conserved hypothetical protein [Thiomonas arsenitoxydans]|uniref:Uncharacterized protein n=2 Tax=Thiomonas arsenitoxydans (strain DSM 22701 / CIP 110005 / 3As) TaxID=426114 RepID=D6CPI6_THIA3|nr:hypothetical protein THI_1223 [Thiomonas arsenitoxydans]CQR26554.1 conserved hypothetical protein [Thiomonas arsenitoxydans]CQR27289.1 conserved hypothetical protein [Thiomonas arsenitoxydans]CQR31369.1 conserved hypothetical protein [Thiomonas arsenitoxydans]CQR31386.1 conserved hypothetical protein [Thiomonas arsenitoxydans]
MTLKGMDVLEWKPQEEQIARHSKQAAALIDAPEYGAQRLDMVRTEPCHAPKMRSL